MSGFKINVPSENLDYSNIIKFVDNNKSDYIDFVAKLKILFILTEKLI